MDSNKKKYYLSVVAVVVISVIVLIGIAFLVIKLFMAPGSKMAKIPLFAAVILIYAAYRYAEPRLKKRYL